MAAGNKRPLEHMTAVCRSTTGSRVREPSVDLCAACTGHRFVLHAGEPCVAGVEGQEGDGDVQPAPAAWAALAGGG